MPAPRRPTPPHVEYGGLRDVDYFLNATWPFARLSVSQESMEIDVVGFRVFRIGKASVVAIRRASGLFAAGLYIRFAVEEREREIVFWSVSPMRLVEEVARRGYAVEGSVTVGPFGVQ